MGVDDPRDCCIIKCLVFVPGSLEEFCLCYLHGGPWDLVWAYANEVTYDGHPESLLRWWLTTERPTMKSENESFMTT